MTATLGKWFFRFKGSQSSTVFTGYANGCSNDAPGIITETNSSCYDGKVYHIVATARNNARYSTALTFSTCGSGPMTLIEATFTADATVTGITCAVDAYDCINGTCTNKNVYKTPGIYATLEACQAACGNTQPMCAAPFECIDPSNFCPPGKVCIPQSQWSQIEGLASKLRQKNCS